MTLVKFGWSNGTKGVNNPSFSLMFFLSPPLLLCLPLFSLTPQHSTDPSFFSKLRLAKQYLLLQQCPLFCLFIFRFPLIYARNWSGGNDDDCCYKNYSNKWQPRPPATTCFGYNKLLNNFFEFLIWFNDFVFNPKHVLRFKNHLVCG